MPRPASFDGCRRGGCYHEETPVTVHISKGLSHDGKGHDKLMGIDSCIASLVEKLYPYTASSCCGHGQTEGRILLHDGRVLKIFNDKSADGAMPDGPWGYSSKGENNVPPG